MCNSYSAGWWGMYLDQTTNPTTTPDGPMAATYFTTITGTSPVSGGIYLMYNRHEQVFTPNTACMFESGQTRSSMFYSWGPSQLVP